MAPSGSTDDGWWFTVLWVVDDDGALGFQELGPAAGPPPEPPVHRLGPALAGALSGLILEEEGRLAIRLAPTGQPQDPTRPWRTAAVIRAAFKFEPLRAATLGEDALARAVLEAFRTAVGSLGRP